MCSGSEAGSYLRLTDSCITPIRAQGPSRTCNESKEEGREADLVFGVGGGAQRAVVDGEPVLPERDFVLHLYSWRGGWGLGGCCVQRSRYGTEVPHSRENSSPQDPTIGPCLGPYGCPRERGVFS